MMVIEGDGETWFYADINDFISFAKTNFNIKKVNFFKKKLTKNNYCYLCKNKLKINPNDFFIDTSFEMKIDENHIFKFIGQCDTCGARYFKHNNKIKYIIDDSIINHRKAKINKLIKNNFI